MSYTIWTRSLIGVDRGYSVSYFFVITRLYKCCAVCSDIWRTVWKMFMWIFFAFFRTFSYRGKVIIKGICNIIGVDYCIDIIKGEYSWYTRYYSSYRNKGFDFFPCILNIIPISSKIFIIISLLVFLYKGGE